MSDLVPEDDGRNPSAQALGDAVAIVHSELNEKLLNVERELSEIANRDCYGDYKSEGDDKSAPCSCERCCAVRALEMIDRIRLPVVRSLHPERLTGSTGERVYFQRWIKENTRSPGLNGGYGLLELIVSTDKRVGLHRPPAYISQRDMDVATTVIQWLGTNVGMGFINFCEGEIKKNSALRFDFERVTHWHYQEYPQKSVFVRVAEKIASETFPDPKDEEKHKRLASQIAKAMLYATVKGEFEKE